MNHKIITEKRSNDYIAYLEGREGIWECAKTEVEAIQKLVLSLVVRYNAKIFSVEL